VRVSVPLDGLVSTGALAVRVAVNPTDRGKLGSKIHLVTDQNGLPLSLGISGANMHGRQGLESLVRGIPPVRSQRGPRRRRPVKLQADKV
jgi:Transposase DDE domain